LSIHLFIFTCDYIPLDGGGSIKNSLPRSQQPLMHPIDSHTNPQYMITFYFSKIRCNTSLPSKPVCLCHPNGHLLSQSQTIISPEMRNDCMNECQVYVNILTFTVYVYILNTITLCTSFALTCALR